MAGDLSSVVLPDPIPNSEVKHAWADDSPGHPGAKVGSCPLVISPSYTEGLFFLYFFNWGIMKLIYKPILLCS